MQEPTDPRPATYRADSRYEAARAWLEAHVTPEGAWGYLPDGPPAPEPTLLACAAGAPAPLDWLDGADLGWAALLLPACLSRVPGARERVAAGAERVLALRGEPVDETPGSYDGRIVGWAWVPGTFSWVEPTAWGLLSLRAAGLGDHPRAAEARRLLRDRQCADGGWNAGTPDVLGQDLPGYAYLTGWVLCALEPGEAAERGLAFLDRQLERPSTRSLALTVLARHAQGRPPGRALDLLRARQRPDGAWSDRVDDTALAAAALRAAERGVFPFREGLDRKPADSAPLAEPAGSAPGGLEPDAPPSDGAG